MDCSTAERFLRSPTLDSSEFQDLQEHVKTCVACQALVRAGPSPMCASRKEALAQLNELSYDAQR